MAEKFTKDNFCTGVTEYTKDGIIYRIDKSKARVINYTDDIPEHVVIPDKIGNCPMVSISNNSFRNCKKIKSITIPNSITKIEDDTFNNCVSLERVIMPENIISIGASAFKTCESLQFITIPEGVKEIGYWAFANCVSLKTIDIPDSVTKINSCAFWGCINLKSMYMPKLRSNNFTTNLFLADTAPKIFFGGTKEKFIGMFDFDIDQYGIAENFDMYRIYVSVCCADGDLIC